MFLILEIMKNFKNQKVINTIKMNASKIKTITITITITTITLLRGKTKKAPPPAASITMAKNFVLTAQKFESQEFFVILMLS